MLTNKQSSLILIFSYSAFSFSNLYIYILIFYPPFPNNKWDYYRKCNNYITIGITLTLYKDK